MGQMLVATERGGEVVVVSTPAELSALYAGYNQAARQYGLESCLIDGKRAMKALTYKRS